MKLRNDLIPDNIADWNLYTERGRAWGYADKIKLPTIKLSQKGHPTAEAPCLEDIDTIVQKIKFTSLYSGIASYVQVGKRINFKIKAAQKLFDPRDGGGYEYEGICITERGVVKEVKLGEIKIGGSDEFFDRKHDASDCPSKLKIDVDYLLVEIGGQWTSDELIFIDRRTGQYRINGVSQIPKAARTLP